MKIHAAAVLDPRLLIAAVIVENSPDRVPVWRTVWQPAGGLVRAVLLTISLLWSALASVMLRRLSAADAKIANFMAAVSSFKRIVM
jgi:hypothetical protein